MIVVKSDKLTETRTKFRRTQIWSQFPSSSRPHPRKTKRRRSSSRLVEGFSQPKGPLAPSSILTFPTRSSLKPVIYTKLDSESFSTHPGQDVRSHCPRGFRAGLIGVGTILLFTPTDDRCLVIHGSTSIFSFTLHSLSIAHRVYAPRPSLLPTIGHVTGGGSISSSIPPPQRLPKPPLQLVYHPSAGDMHGRGRSTFDCRPFEGLFEPSKVARMRHFAFRIVYVYPPNKRHTAPHNVPTWNEPLPTFHHF